MTTFSKKRPTMFLFSEGDTVALKEDYPGLGLRAGDTGVIWVSYSTTPPAYDVTFQDAEGRAFDMVLDEDELTVPTPTRPSSGGDGEEPKRNLTPALSFRKERGPEQERITS